ALDNFRASSHMAELLGGEVRDKFAELKQASADRCPRLLGTRIKRAEVQFHHEVTNQHLWSNF
ncbi:MAG TPA: glutamine synthetase, partial [Roseiflexaceae bacterium]|nr:glutamine synthetase [Roseiflexaceae bacterium]